MENGKWKANTGGLRSCVRLAMWWYFWCGKSADLALT